MEICVEINKSCLDVVPPSPVLQYLYSVIKKDYLSWQDWFLLLKVDSWSCFFVPLIFIDT
jgi:hypothetical protein